MVSNCLQSGLQMVSISLKNWSPNGLQWRLFLVSKLVTNPGKFTFIFFSLHRGDVWRVIKQSSTFWDFTCNLFILAIKIQTDWLTTSEWITTFDCLTTSDWLAISDFNLLKFLFLTQSYWMKNHLNRSFSEST